MSHIQFMRRGLPILFGLMIVFSANTASAQSFKGVRNACRDIAETASQYVISIPEAEKSVSLGVFQGPPTSSAGIVITKTLKELLPESGVRIRKVGGYQLRGSFRAEARGDQITFAINVVLVDKNGDVVEEFPATATKQRVGDLADVAAIAGATVDTTIPAGQLQNKPESSTQTNSGIIKLSESVIYSGRTDSTTAMVIESGEERTDYALDVKTLISTFGLGTTKTETLDAVTTTWSGMAYGFKHSLVSRVDLSSGELISGYPRKLEDEFPGMPFTTGVDATFVDANSQLFFFKNDQFVRYSMESNSIIGQVTRIADSWSGESLTSSFHTGINAATMHTNGKICLFRGDQVAHFSRHESGFRLDKVATANRREFAFMVPNASRMLQLSGFSSNVETQRSTSPRDRAEILAISVRRPSVRLEQNSLIMAAEGSPYQIEILKKRCNEGVDAYRPVPVINEDGHAFVDLSNNENWAIRIINRSQYDAAVVLTIDGLSVFEFCEVPAWKKTNRILVPRNYSKGWVIPGWFIDAKRKALFRTASLPDSEAAKLNRQSASIGTITASFFCAWKQDEPQPAIEPLSSRGSKAIGTARGAVVQSKSRNVSRYMGRSLLAAISVRYAKPDAAALAASGNLDEIQYADEGVPIRYNERTFQD